MPPRRRAAAAADAAADAAAAEAQRTPQTRSRTARAAAATAAAAAPDAAAAAVVGVPGLYSIIAPTYNEAENVPLLVALLREACGAAGIDYELVVVDDASPDGTADVVRALQACYDGGEGRLVLVTRPGKLGLGSAYAAGLAVARGEWVLLMDADLSHHPRHVADLIARQRATGADVVGGSRYLPGGGVAGWGAGRKLTSRGANVLARTLLGLAPVSDLTGAFRLYRRSLLARLLARCRCRGYAFQMEMAARAVAAGARFEEVAIVFVDRVYGASKLGPHEFAQFLAGLARLLVEL